jgi:hypothetical protein
MNENVLILLVVILVGAGYAATMNFLTGARYLLGNRIMESIETIRAWRRSRH